MVARGIFFLCVLIEAAHKTVESGSDEDLFCVLKAFVAWNKKFRQVHGQ